MKPAIGFVLICILAEVLAQGDEPRGAPPADFKVNIEYFGVQKEPVRRAQLVVRKGRGYWLLSDSNEVIIYDPTEGQVELLDLERRIHTEVPIPKLEEAIAKLRQLKTAAIEKLEEAGGRANILAAAMSRNLIEPKLEVAFDAAQKRLKLTNAERRRSTPSANPMPIPRGACWKPTPWRRF